MTYDDDNRLATFKGRVWQSSCRLDSDGNLTNGPLTNDTFVSYTYDARNRLLNAGGVTNAYDAMNNRIGQTYGTNTTIFVVNPNAKLAASVDADQKRGDELLCLWTGPALSSNGNRDGDKHSDVSL